MALVKITASIAEDLARRLDDEARRRDLSRSSMLGEVVAAFFQRLAAIGGYIGALGAARWFQIVRGIVQYLNPDCLKGPSPLCGVRQAQGPQNLAHCQ